MKLTVRVKSIVLVQMSLISFVNDYRKLTTRTLLSDSHRDISQTGLSSHVAFSKILDVIRCTNRYSAIGTSGTYTLRCVVHHSAANVVWSTTALGSARICKAFKYMFVNKEIRSKFEVPAFGSGVWQVAIN